MKTSRRKQVERVMKKLVYFIAPYPAMLPLIEELKDEFPALEVKVEVGNLKTGAAIARKAEKAGAHALISRGGTTELIRHTVTMPVIDVQVSGYDMLRAIMMASGSEGQKAIIGFSSITIGARAILDLLDIDMDVFTIKGAEEVDGLIRQLKNKGYARVLGDVVTVEASRRYGLDGLLIQSGREAILGAFETAEQEIAANRRMHWLLAALRRMLSNTETDMCLIDSNGTVLFEHWRSFDHCPIDHRQLQAVLGEGQQSETARLIPLESGGMIELSSFSLENGDEKVTAFLFNQLKTSSNELPGFKVEEVGRPAVISESDAMKRMLQAAERPETAQVLLLLQGQTGSGKEFFAKYIHSKHDKKGLFVSVDVSRHTFSEVAGHLPAKTATIFLRRLEALGENGVAELEKWQKIAQERKAQLILAVTAKQPWLDAWLARQEVLHLIMPSLEDRQADIPGLALHFLTEFHQTLGTQPIRLKEEALELLKEQNWSRNVAELEEVIRSLAMSEKGYVLEKETVKEMLRKSKPGITAAGIPLISIDGTMKEIEQRVITLVLEEENFRQTDAARRLGISRATLWRKLKGQ